LLSAIKDNEVDNSIKIIPDLMGKFGGELDSFYEIIMSRCTDTGSTKFSIPGNLPEQ
jgi:hypothetical protein